MPHIDVNSRETQCEKQVIEKVERESNDLLELEKNEEVHEEKPRIQGKLIDGIFIYNQDSNNGTKNLVVEDDKFPKELIDALKKDQFVSASSSSPIDAFIENQLGSAPGSSFIDALKKDQLVSAPDSSLIDALKEDHFVSAPGSSLIKENQLGPAQGFSWRRIQEDYGEVNGADGDESLDSGSDGAESSSADASMADIMPMLDELHPLLELEDPQRGCTSHDGSRAGSERSHENDDECMDTEENTDNQGGEGESEDDNDEDDRGEGESEGVNDDEEEGETATGQKEDESKSAIRWTEVDQKNLMDLGTLELERNRCLENLIARRIARKNMKLMAEKNLIDLESYDLPFSFSSIAATRRNPFELPVDTYDDMAIPGSAPSILLPNQNPFDLPYDSNEEKPDLQGDSFPQEFSAIQHKETVYRRNETFSIGSSVFGSSRHERQDFKWRPYFVPERSFSEEGTGFPLFLRQLSEASDSKLSSIHDSESKDSAVDEDQTSHEQLLGQFSLEGMSNATLQQQISEVSESKVGYVPDTESDCSVVDDEDKKLNEQDDSRENNETSNIDYGAKHVECGSRSSGEVDFYDIEQAKNRDVLRDEVVITLGDVGNHQKNEPRFLGTQSTSSQELKENESHLETEPGEEYSSRSSYSSLSEVDDNIPDMRKEEDLKTLEGRENFNEKSGVSTHSSLEETEFQFMSEVVEHREPVYDSSPTGMERFLSFTSISSDTQLEISEMTSLPTLLETAKNESEVYSEDTEDDSSGFEDTCASPSQDHAVDENESISREFRFSEAGELNAKEDRSLGVDTNFGGKKESFLSLFSSDIVPSEYTVYRGEHFLPDRRQVVSSSHDSKTFVGASQDPDEKLDSVTPANSTLFAIDRPLHSMAVEHVLVQPNVSSSETEIVEKHLIQLEQDDGNMPSLSDKQLIEEGVRDKSRDKQHDSDKVHSSNFDADIHDDGHHDGSQEQDPPFVTEQAPMVYLSFSSSATDCVQGLSSNSKETHRLVQSSSLENNDFGVHHDADVRVVVANFGYEDVPSEEKSSSKLEKQLSWSDKSPSYNELQEAPTNPTESIEDLIIVNNENAYEDHNYDEKILKNFVPMTTSFTSTPFESPQSRSPGREEVNIVSNGNAFEIHDDDHKTQRNSSSLTTDSGSTTLFQSPGDQSPGGEDVKEDTLVHRDSGYVEEHFYNSVEAYDPCVNEENINDETGEISEIGEDIHVVLKQVSQSDCSAKVEKRGVVSTDQSQSSCDVHSGIQEDSGAAADELKHVYDETSGDSSSSMSDDKKGKHGKRRSSPRSCSNSNSSDSD